MIDHEDRTKLTLIDFEYSMPNFRGFDIASYYIESYFDYSYPKKPNFKVYEEFKMSFEPHEEVEKMAIAYLTRYHEKHNMTNPDESLDKLLEKELPILMD